MTRPILFATRQDPTTCRRYLRLIDEFQRRDIPSIIASVTPGVPEALAKQRDYEGLTQLEYRTIDLEEVRDDRAPTPFRVECPPRNEPLFSPKKGSLTGRGECSLNDLVSAVGLNFNVLFANQLDSMLASLKPWVGGTDTIVSELKPLCVIYDIEAIAPNLALIHSARRNGIPIVSLEHAGGFGPQYSHYPLLADAYVAYCPYNAEILRRAGVAEKRIFLRGAPESNPFSSERRDAATNARRTLGLREEERVLLINLQGIAGHPSLKQDNLKMVRQALSATAAHPDVRIVLRPHPVDLLLHRPQLDAALREFQGNLILHHPVNPIEESLLFSDLFLTFTSTSIVQAIESDTEVVSVETSISAEWPEWATVGAYPTLRLDEVESFLSERLKIGIDKPLTTSRVRRAFLERFSLRRDIGNAIGIADDILDLIAEFERIEPHTRSQSS